MRAGWIAVLCMAGCIGPAAEVRYRPLGQAGDAVVLVEERTTPRRRDYLVVCHPDRTPVCARMRPGNATTSADLATWTESGRDARPTIPLEPPAAIRTGRLSVMSVPWCVLSIDGVEIDQTPIANLPLTPGEHVLACRNPVTGAEQSARVAISAGNTTRQVFRLAANPTSGAPAAPSAPVPQSDVDAPAAAAPSPPTRHLPLLADWPAPGPSPPAGSD